MSGLHPSVYSLLQTLADGRFRSGAELGRHFGVSRTAVWKHVQAIERLGLEVQAVRGRGYRIAGGLDLLDREQIFAALEPHTRAAIGEIEIHQDVDSTNAVLQRRPEFTGGVAVLAERQTAGRGRRGRTWISPYAANVYLSLAWRLPAGPAELGGLSLALGVAMARCVGEWGVAGAGLKWPNDLQIEGRKVGGLLLEVSGEAAGPSHLVVGAGLNVRMPASAGGDIDQPWTDLARASRRGVIRSELAGRLLHHLVCALQDYERGGFAAFIEEWRQRDVLTGQPVRVALPTEHIEGVALDIDHDGALLLQCGGATRRIQSGEVSVRLTAQRGEFS